MPADYWWSIPQDSLLVRLKDGPHFTAAVRQTISKMPCPRVEALRRVATLQMPFERQAEQALRKMTLQDYDGALA